MSGNKSKIPTINIDASEILGAPIERGTPERNLLMAMLERAILDFVGNKETEITEAEEWLFSDKGGSDGAETFSFAWVCEHLDLDAKNIADVIKAMPKRGSRRVAPWYFKEENKLCG